MEKEIELESTCNPPRPPYQGGEDALPEESTYHDEGCELARACLSCPLPRCRYDDPGVRRNPLKNRRNHDIAHLRQAEGIGIGELAAKFGLSKRSVHRILRRANRE